MEDNNRAEGFTAQFSELELARKRMISVKNKIHILFGILTLAVFIAVLLIFKKFFVAIALGVLIAGGWYYLIDRENNKFGQLFKQLVMIPFLLEQFPSMVYHREGIEKKAFLASELYKKNDVDRYNSEDMFSGMHGKTKFRFSEVHAEREHRDSDGGSSYVTIFQGIFLIADFNKSLKGSTRVVQAKDNFFKKFLNRKKQVSLEHPEFEGIFNTYGDDQIEARYILSTAMMERILKLQAKWKDELRISFIRDHVFIAVNHKRNLFEPDLGREIDKTQLDRIMDEVSTCLEIMDILDLNTRIWTKE